MGRSGIMSLKEFEEKEKYIRGAGTTRLQEYEGPELIGEGYHGFVYKISDTRIAKIAGPYVNLIGREEKIAKKLFEYEISIPEPFGIQNIPIITNLHGVKKERIFDAFIMEFIPGKTGYELEEYNHRDFEKSKLLLSRELGRAREKGFDPGVDGFSLKNYIFTPDKKIKLIDFAM